MAVRVSQGGRFARALLLAIGGAIITQAGLPPGWRFAGPYPQGNTLHAVWAAAEDEVFVGGDGGVIGRWNGTTWTLMDTPTQKSIFALSGTSPTDVWAVGGDAYTLDPGDHSLILHYDGTAWAEMTAPDFLGYRYVFTSVLALAPDDVWATIETSTQLMHFNGARWEWITPGGAGALEGALRAIAAVDAHDLFFVGTHGQILHKAGNEWILEQKTEEGNFTANLLGCVWAGALDQVYAGGNYGQVYRRQADGSWVELDMQTGIDEGGVRSIWGRSPTEVYFLMGSGALRRYDGQHPPVKLETPFSGTDGFALSDRMWAVSGSMAREFVPDTEAGVVSVLTVPRLAKTPVTYWRGVSPLDDRSLLGWGNAYPNSDGAPLTVLSETGIHEFSPLPPGMTRDARVNAVLATGADDIVLCWENWVYAARGVHHWNGAEWEPLMGGEGNFDVGPPVEAFALWRAPSGALYAAEKWRLLRLNADHRWERRIEIPFPEMATRTFNAFWARAENEMYFTTEQGEILRYDGTSLVAETTPTSDVSLRALGGDATHVYVVGDDGVAWYRDQGTWKPLPGVEAREGDHFTGLATGQGGVYALQATAAQFTGGGLYRLWRFDGATATRVASGLSGGAAGFADFFLSTTTSGRVYVVSSKGQWLFTDQPAPEGFVLQRFDRSTAGWTPLGETGVELQPATPEAGFVVAAAWRVDEPSPFPPPELVGDGALAGQHWVARADATALPSVRLRLRYDPARQPDGSWTAATLLHYDGAAWNPVPATLDPATHTVAANHPTPLSEWTFVWQTAVAPRSLTIERADGGMARLSWPAGAGDAELETTTALTPETTWTPVPTPPEIIDRRNVVEVPASDRDRFFRLRE